ncbi:cytochrome c oxidase subunit 6B2 [Aplysia californica]|uniref:Cytochrome c oxidase subunit 6B2 n=1 Tax=Aplysia californica TaxID=6500 RepID=A0ABM0JMP0_APLCA|nr:cytochrome c oxidase subunit 6B2 [Aplysia californica]
MGDSARTSSDGKPCSLKVSAPCPPSSAPLRPAAAAPPAAAAAPPRSDNGPAPDKAAQAPQASKSSQSPPCKEIWSPGFDARFPNMNMTRRCWQNYVDYYRCQEKLGEDYEPCEYFKKTFTYLCPEFWIEQWDDQREAGCFPMPAYKKCGC